MMKDDKPRMTLDCLPPPAPGWLLGLRSVRRKTGRGWRRFWRGCWWRHSYDLVRTRAEDGAMEWECPTCDLKVGRVLEGQVFKARPVTTAGEVVQFKPKTGTKD